MAGRTRHDPASRDVDGRVAFEEIAGKDPDRHYALVNPNDSTGLEWYKARKYTIEYQRKDGPRPTLGATETDGDEIRSGGQILVSRPMDVHLAETARLAKQADELEKRILKDERVDDGFRGRGVTSRPMMRSEAGADEPYADQ